MSKDDFWKNLVIEERDSGFWIFGPHWDFGPLQNKGLAIRMKDIVNGAYRTGRQDVAKPIRDALKNDL